ncbi:MAG: hypothetical protein J7539_16115, partial [Niabella sp.]|nr:hypothetical protein [Niabella sp.]
MKGLINNVKKYLFGIGFIFMFWFLSCDAKPTGKINSAEEVAVQKESDYIEQIRKRLNIPAKNDIFVEDSA